MHGAAASSFEEWGVSSDRHRTNWLEKSKSPAGRHRADCMPSLCSPFCAQASQKPHSDCTEVHQMDIQGCLNAANSPCPRHCLPLAQWQWAPGCVQRWHPWWCCTAVVTPPGEGGHLHFSSIQSKHLASSNGDVICARRGMPLWEQGNFHSALQQDQAAWNRASFLCHWYVYDAGLDVLFMTTVAANAKNETCMPLNLLLWACINWGESAKCSSHLP